MAGFLLEQIHKGISNSLPSTNNVNLSIDLVIIWLIVKSKTVKSVVDGDEIPIERNCSYDHYGLKWKLPILGQL